MTVNAEPMIAWTVLPAPGDFNAVYQRGRKFFAPALGLFVLPAPGGARYGVVASRKQVGNAVARNRAKRRLRAAIRNVLCHQALPDAHYVLVATPRTNAVPFTELENDLLHALRRLQRLPNAA